jgi:zinc protease
VVVAVGAITMAQLQQLADGQLGNWTHAAVPRAPPPPPVERLPATPAITLIDQATLTQSEILVAAPGSSALADDFAALEVLNAVLCGAATTGSRLNAVLREQLGYTYVALSTIVPRLGPGPLLLRQAVAKENTAAALRETMHQIDRLRREDVPEDELAVAKARLQSSVLLTYDSFPETLRTLIRLAMLGLPARHTALQLARLDRVSARDVRLAAAKYLAADRLRVVVAGDVAAVRKPLQASGLGRVQVLER